MFHESLALRTPGPTPLPPSVQLAAARPAIYHRGPTFEGLYRRCAEGLQRIFGTAHEVLLLTASSTGAMEAAVAASVWPGAKATVLVGGKFGERWAELCTAYGCMAEVLPYPVGEGARPESLDAHLAAHPGTEVVFATYNESSTAVCNDVAALAETAHRHGALIVVDAVSIAGGAPLEMDAWGLDVVVAGSQKCLMIPPGLGFIALNERAWARAAGSPSPRYYLDPVRHKKAAMKGQTPYTPNTQLIVQLAAALDLIESEGLPAVFARHRLLRAMVRAGGAALGCPPFVDERWASPTLTAFLPPDGVRVPALTAALRERFGVEIVGGQGELAATIFRIGHMGYVTPADMIVALAALEHGLAAQGHAVRWGAGLSAAQEVWAKWA
ncbi:MAG TPA: alanine--glyoxylate aminotransferase family protein [Limnochordia bacterium]|nr:alanine--glyoxylate aminotransferase family protein [Limnochordia bacterium]